MTRIWFIEPSARRPEHLVVLDLPKAICGGQSAVDREPPVGVPEVGEVKPAETVSVIRVCRTTKSSAGLRLRARYRDQGDGTRPIDAQYDDVMKCRVQLDRDRPSATAVRAILLAYSLGGTLPHATASVFHQRHIGRVLRSSRRNRGRRVASSRHAEHRSGRCPPLWPGDV
jgi:hypothetical protein